MKSALIYILLFAVLTLSAQQSSISGVVSIHNSEYETGKRQYVQNAQVEDDFEKAQSTTTASDGSFKLVFVKVDEKTSVNLILKKEGLQVVNIDALSAIAGQRDLLHLSMSKPERIAEYRRQIYKVGKTEAEKNLAAQLKKKSEAIVALQQNVQKNATEIEKRQKEYSELQAYTQKLEEQAQALARHYGPINLDDATPQYRAAFEAFQKGNIDSALLIIREADLNGQSTKMLQKETLAHQKISEGQKDLEDVAQKKPQLIQSWQLKADLHKNRFEFDSVYVCYKKMLLLDSTNIRTLQQYASFLAFQNAYDKAIEIYKKIEKTNPSDEVKAFNLNSLGNAYRALRDTVQAKTAYTEALTIFKKLATIKEEDYLSYLGLIYNNMGNLIKINQKRNRYNNSTQDAGAIDTFKIALSIYEKLAAKNRKTYQPYIVLTLNNLGRSYYENKDYYNAQKTFSRCIDEYEDLAQTDAHSILTNEIQNFIDINFSFDDNDKEAYIFDKFSKSLLNRALKVHRQMSQQNPVFLPVVALTLNNLGKLYGNQYNLKQAEVSFNEALEILENLAQQNPKTYFPFVVHVLKSKTKFYEKTGKKVEANATLNKALEIEKKYNFKED